MRFDCQNIGFHFEMNNNDFLSLNEKGMATFFNMGESQIEHTLFAFAEAKDNKWTGRGFTMTLDSGRYSNESETNAGYELNIENLKKYTPLTLLSRTTIMPGNIMHLVWQEPQGGLLSQYYMVKNTCMICTAGMISKENDDLDNLMAFVCISATAENMEELQREQQQNLMQEVTAEANRLAASGMPIEQAMEEAFKKYGIKANK